MAQVKIYGRRSVWGGRQAEISDALQRALVDVWGLPAEKRFHRFLLLADEDVVAPGRGADYLVIEVICFTGRSRAAKRALIAAVFDDVVPGLGMSTDDVEIVFLEVPACDWGIRGRSGDELELPYRVDV
jgi:phenylpyruvate tautomerase PptA (4-oxalocrotonate tautomerase family)